MLGIKDDKIQITLTLIVNADGSNIHDPLIISQAHRPHCFERKDGIVLGFDYHWNKKAWMTGDIFE